MDNKLIGLHNLTKEKMEKVLNRGGFICPSIALTTEDNCLCNRDFGNITVVFKDDIFDPTRNKDVLLLSADGYTANVKWIDEDLSNEDVVEEIKDIYFNDDDFMYEIGENICKSMAAVPITLEQANTEIDRIISEDEYDKYFDEVLTDKYYDFLDNNWKGWDCSDTEKKYVFRTPYLEENSLRPSVESAIKFSIKACSQCETIAEKKKVVKETCNLCGLKVSPKKISNIIDFADELRNDPILYFEAKVFQVVPLSEVKGLIIPEEEIYKPLIDRLEQTDVPFKTYSDHIERKQAIIEVSKGKKQILDQIIRNAKDKVKSNTINEMKELSK